MHIEKNKVVEIYYELNELEGGLLDKTTQEKPLKYLHGHNNLVDGLEKALEKAIIGDKICVTLSPEEGYGEYDTTQIQQIKRQDLDLGIDYEDLQEGMIFVAEIENKKVPFSIKRIIGDMITLDANHFLAGKTLVFNVEVISIRDATAEEILQGLAQN